MSGRNSLCLRVSATLCNIFGLTKTIFAKRKLIDETFTYLFAHIAAIGFFSK